MWRVNGVITVVGGGGGGWGGWGGGGGSGVCINAKAMASDELLRLFAGFAFFNLTWWFLTVVIYE